MKEPVAYKTCKTCKQTKPIGEFYTSKTLRDGLYSECKRCHNARRRPDGSKSLPLVSVPEDVHVAIKPTRIKDNAIKGGGK